MENSEEVREEMELPTESGTLQDESDKPPMDKQTIDAHFNLALLKVWKINDNNKRIGDSQARIPLQRGPNQNFTEQCPAMVQQEQHENQSREEHIQHTIRQHLKRSAPDDEEQESSPQQANKPSRLIEMLLAPLTPVKKKARIDCPEPQPPYQQQQSSSAALHNEQRAQEIPTQSSERLSTSLNHRQVSLKNSEEEPFQPCLFQQPHQQSRQQFLLQEPSRELNQRIQQPKRLLARRPPLPNQQIQQPEQPQQQEEPLQEAQDLRQQVQGLIQRLMQQQSRQRLQELEEYIYEANLRRQQYVAMQEHIQKQHQLQSPQHSSLKHGQQSFFSNFSGESSLRQSSTERFLRSSVSNDFPEQSLPQDHPQQISIQLLLQQISSQQHLQHLSSEDLSVLQTSRNEQQQSSSTELTALQTSLVHSPQKQHHSSQQVSLRSSSTDQLPQRQLERFHLLQSGSSCVHISQQQSPHRLPQDQFLQQLNSEYKRKQLLQQQSIMQLSQQPCSSTAKVFRQLPQELRHQQSLSQQPSQQSGQVSPQHQFQQSFCEQLLHNSPKDLIQQSLPQESLQESFSGQLFQQSPQQVSELKISEKLSNQQSLLDRDQQPP